MKLTLSQRRSEQVVIEQLPEGSFFLFNEQLWSMLKITRVERQGLVSFCVCRIFGKAEGSQSLDDHPGYTPVKPGAKFIAHEPYWVNLDFGTQVDELILAMEGEPCYSQS